MNIKTKFTFGDMVIPIELKEEKESVPCTGCDATGTILLKDGREHSCPVCEGKGKVRVVKGKKWTPVTSLFGSTLLKVTQIAMFEKIAAGEESYLLGNTYYEADDVFSNREEAVAECEKRNARILECGVTLH